MTFRILVGASLLSLVALTFACSSDDPKTPATPTTENGEPTSPFPSCQAILHACHPLDVGEGAIHDCHETAHDDGTEAKCAAAKDHCLEVCVSDAGAPADGG